MYTGDYHIVEKNGFIHYCGGCLNVHFVYKNTMISICAKSILDFKHDIERYIHEILIAQVPKGTRIRIKTPFEGLYFLYHIDELYEIKQMLDRYVVLNPALLHNN
ncbi:MAG TPA: hypothetical protein PKD85_06405 [Saprospiraceae bacterium]|nr:hypothetical protein [Saprospiraceae bacterium]